jgi:antitoxin component YwqK of YwqJK toxin-antitoxin module
MSKYLISIAVLICFQGCDNKLHKTYYTTGELESEFYEKDGHPDSINRSYYKNGKIKYIAYYKNGKLNGNKQYFYDSGKLSSETEYVDGKANGRYREFNESGKLIIASNFRNDKENGIAKEFYLNGKIKGEYEYKDDKKNGFCKTYDENGKLKTYEIYVNDSTKYLEKYDEKNKSIVMIRTMDVTPELDTIRLGVPYSANIKIYGPINSKHMLGVEINKHWEKEVIPLKNNVAEYHFLPKKQGVYNLNFCFFDEIVKKEGLAISTTARVVVIK